MILEALDTILQGKVIGWFQGRFEWGPRALGSRSILADPRRGEMKEIVNTPADALKTFANSDIDQLVMGPFLVSKPEYLTSPVKPGPVALD